MMMPHFLLSVLNIRLVTIVPVAQTFAKTFGSLSGEQFISKTDPQGPKIFSVKPGETPVAGESVQQTGGSDSPMADIIGLVASQGYT